MRKLIESRVKVVNQVITEIVETLDNTGNLALTKEPKSNAMTKDIIDVLKKYNMIDIEDDTIEFLITIKA